MVQQGVKECLIPEDNTGELKLIQKILLKCNIMTTLVKKNAFKDTNIMQDMTRLLEKDSKGMSEFDCVIAIQSAAALISYLGLLENEYDHSSFKLEKYHISQYMKLDSSAVNALNLMPNPKDGNKNMCLYGLLNRCKTAQGSRMLSQWIKQPLLNIEQITKRQNFVDIFVNESCVRQSIQIISSFPDLHRIGKKFQKQKANLQDVVRIYQAVKIFPEIINALDSYSGNHKALAVEKFIDPLKVN